MKSGKDDFKSILLSIDVTLEVYCESVPIGHVVSYWRHMSTQPSFQSWKKQ